MVPGAVSTDDLEGLPESEPPRPTPRATLGERVRQTLAWIGPSRLLTGLGVVVTAGVGGWWLLHAPPPPVERSLPVATTAVPAEPVPSSSAAVAPATVDGWLLVHVAGAVRSPGVVRLASGARVVDAVAAAGGAVADADLDGLNLAAPAIDGARVYVPRQGEHVTVPVADPGPGGTGSVPSGPIDLNTATVTQLDTLPGIGPSTAQAIVDHRDRNGPFRTVDDLLDVRGVGPAKLEQFRHLVTV